MATETVGRRAVLGGAGLAAFITLAHVLNDVFQHMLPVLLPTLQVRFGLTETLLAVLVAVLFFSSSVLQPLGGALSDRFGRRLVAAGGVIACVSLLSLVGIAPTVLMLMLLLFFGGLGSAAFHPAGTSIARGAMESRKDLVTSIFISGGTIGASIGPVIILFVIGRYGLEAMPWLMIPGVIIGILIYLLVEPQPRASGAERAKLFDWGLLSGPVGALCASGILRTMTWVTFPNAMPLYLVAVHGVDRGATIIGLTVGLFALSGGAGGILASMLAGRYDRRYLITGSMLLALPALLVTLHAVPGTLAYFTAVAVAGAMTNAALPLMIVSAQDLAPHAVGTATGLLMGFTWGTAGVIYIGIGALQETIGFAPAMQVSYFCLIPAALLAHLVLSRARRRAP